MIGELLPVPPNVDGMNPSKYVVARCDGTKATGGFDYHAGAWAVLEMVKRTGEVFVLWRIKRGKSPGFQWAHNPYVRGPESLEDGRHDSTAMPEKGMPRAARKFFGA